MNGQLAVVEERSCASFVRALVLQLPRVDHGLVSPESVSRPVFFPAKRTHVRSIGLSTIRTRFVRIHSVGKVRSPMFSERCSLFEYSSAALKVARVLLLVRRLDVRPQLLLVVKRHLEKTRRNKYYFPFKTMFTQLQKNSLQLEGGWPQYTSVHFCN